MSFSGGVFRSTRLRETFARRLGLPESGYRLQPPAYPPVVGAALYAAKEAGAPLDTVALGRLRQRPVRAGTAAG